MDFKWSDDLSAIVARNQYNVRRGEPNYGATEPLDAKPCRCESPGFARDADGEERCWKCGACPTDAAAFRS